MDNNINEVNNKIIIGDTEYITEFRNNPKIRSISIVNISHIRLIKQNPLKYFFVNFFLNMKVHINERDKQYNRNIAIAKSVIRSNVFKAKILNKLSNLT